MTLPEFQGLSPNLQLYHVLQKGTMLASRRHFSGSLDLYCIDCLEQHFLIEVDITQAHGRTRMSVQRSFVATLPQGRLPEGWA